MPDAGYHLSGGVQPRLKRFADLAGPDFYPTPPWATRALLAHERFAGAIWECACGGGHMSEELKATGAQVFSSDLYDRGYGTPGIDFLRATKPISNVITNPPFNAAEGFARQGLKLARRKVCLLLRLAFLEGGNRAVGLFKEHPPSRVWVFSQRLTMYPATVEKRGGGALSYAWFVWDKQDTSGLTLVKWFPPIYKPRGRIL